MEYNYQTLLTYYTKVGKGPPLILLHGWGQNKETFRQILEELKDSFTIYIPDLIGFGYSDEPDTSYNVNDYVKFLKAFIQDLNIIDPIILGHSFGGRIAIKYAYSNPNIKMLVLVSSAGIKKRSIKKTLKIIKYKLIRKYYKMKKDILAYNRLKTNSGSSDYYNATNLMKGTLSKVIKEDLTKYLKKIKVKTLIIWGKNDLTTPYKDAIKMKHYLKNSQLITFNGCGHFPYIEKQTDFIKVLKLYLQGDNNDLL